jgi:beta-glucosidase
MPAARRTPFRPRLEILEGRCLLSGSGNPAVVPVPAGVQWLGEDVRLGAHRGHPAVIFLGDSILSRFADGPGADVWRREIAPLGAADFAIAGSTTQNTLWQIDHDLLHGLSPRVVVLLVGTNNLGAGESPAEVAGGIAACLGAIQARQPHVRVLLLGILPRGDSSDAGMGALIGQTNTLLAGVAAQYHAAFLDAGPALLSPGGTISRTILGDSLHPTTEGYRILAGEIRSAVLALLGGG